MRKFIPLWRAALALLLLVSVTHFTLPGQGVMADTATISISNAAVSPGTVAPPNTATLSAKVYTLNAMPGSIVDFEVFNAAGTRVYQTYQTGVNLAANSTQNFNANWAVPASEPSGAYLLRVGVFNQWWSYRYAWTDAGTAFQVAAPLPTNTPAPSPTSTPVPISIANAAVSPGTVAPPNTATLSAKVYTLNAMPGSIVDFEVFNAAGTRVYQTYQTGVNLAANSTQSFSANWAVPASEPSGAYLLRVGVFNQWWSYRYAWTDAGTAFQVAAPLPTNTPAPSPTSTSGPSATPLALGVWIPGDEYNPSVVDSFRDYGRQGTQDRDVVPGLGERLLL